MSVFAQLRPVVFIASSVLLGLPACAPKWPALAEPSLRGEGLGPKAVLTVAGESPFPLEQKVQEEQASPGEVGAAILPLDHQSFKVLLRYEAVWGASLDVLLRNYNLNIVDRHSGVITTEWDSYYLGQEVYRNKVSIRLTQLSFRSCQLTILNNVEVLRDGSVAGTGTIGAIWLPSQDTANETQRLIRNIATLLNQAPPHFPANMVKADEKRKGF